MYSYAKRKHNNWNESKVSNALTRLAGFASGKLDKEAIESMPNGDVRQTCLME